MCIHLKKTKYPTSKIVESIRERFFIIFLALPFFMIGGGFQNDEGEKLFNSHENVPQDNAVQDRTPKENDSPQFLCPNPSENAVQPLVDSTHQDAVQPLVDRSKQDAVQQVQESPILIENTAKPLVDSAHQDAVQSPNNASPLENAAEPLDSSKQNAFPAETVSLEGNVKTEKNCKWNLSGEFLYWTISAAQMDYVVERTRPKDGQVPYDGNYSAGMGTAFFGGLHKHKFHWDPGFRLGVSYETDKDEWNLCGLYTYFHSHSLSGKDPKSGPFDYLNGTFFQASDIPVIKARSCVHFSSDAAELHLARSFKASKAITFQFIAGAIASWVDMKWRVEFVGSTIFPNRLVWKFKGGGLDMGLKSLWNIVSELNFCLDGAVSALYGTHHNSYQSASVPNHQDAWALLFDKDHRVVWKTNLKSGFSWLKKYSSFGYEVFVGVEVNTWFNLNENYRPLISTPVSAISSVRNERPRFLDSCPMNIYGLSTRFNLSF